MVTLSKGVAGATGTIMPATTGRMGITSLFSRVFSTCLPTGVMTTLVRGKLATSVAGV